MASNLELILIGLKNLLYKRLNRDMIGYSKETELPPSSLEDVRLYAAATNDDPETYLDNSIIPPLFVSRLIHPFLTDIITDSKLKMNILKMVHGELLIRWIKPVYVSDRLTLRIDLKEIQDTSAGELLKISFLILKEGEIAAEAIAGLLIRNPSQEKSKKVEEEREIIYTTSIQTTSDQAIRYAKASLDNNLIHTSRFFAKIVGLKKPILHGVCLFAITCNELLKKFASGEKTRLISMSARFAYPVYPGEAVTLRCFNGESENSILFDIINSQGRQNIKFGKFEFKK